jgi:hypothetical protein
MVRSGEEEKIRRILTDARLSAIKAMLEKDHAIDCIFPALYGEGEVEGSQRVYEG